RRPALGRGRAARQGSDLYPAAGRTPTRSPRVGQAADGSRAMTALVIFAALSLADAWLTVAILERGGREANPVMRALMEYVGVIPALAGTKILAVALLWAVGLSAVTWGAAAAYVGICAWNVRVLRRLGTQ